MINYQHSDKHVEAGLLMKEFEAAGFNIHVLSRIPIFISLMKSYGNNEITHREFFDSTEKLAIMNPNIKMSQCS